MDFKKNIKHFCELNTAHIDSLTKFDAVIIALQDKLKAIPFYFRHDKLHMYDIELQVSPGMAVRAEIKIRKKIIDSFLEPFQTYKSEALRER